MVMGVVKCHKLGLTLPKPIIFSGHDFTFTDNIISKNPLYHYFVLQIPLKEKVESIVKNGLQLKSSDNPTNK